MSRYQDQEYLLTEQYHTSEKLNTRIQLHVQFSTNDYGWFPWVFDHFDLDGESRILELGCGPGDLWLENIGRIPPGWEVNLSDFSPGMVSKARGRLLEQGRLFNFWNIDAQAIPFEDNCLDAVIANHCIYHFPDRPKAISEIQRVLKPGGVFYATTVGDDHLKELPDLVSNFEVEIEDAFDPSGNPFTLESGGDQLRAWFSDIQTDRYLDSLVVTETAPLVDFLLSTARFSLDEIKRDDLSAHIQSLMQSNGGAIFIHKDSGIFISSKA